MYAHTSEMSAVVRQVFATAGPHSAGFATPHSHIEKRIGPWLHSKRETRKNIAARRYNIEWTDYTAVFTRVPALRLVERV